MIYRFIDNHKKILSSYLFISKYMSHAKLLDTMAEDFELLTVLLALATLK